MSDQIEDLIREIAAKHGIAVARDDPILVLQTINNRLLQDSAAAQQAQLTQFKEELEGISLRWQMDAKDKAERILNAALTAGKTTLEKTLQDSATTTAKLTRTELERVMEQVIQRARESRQAALINLAASCLTISALAVAAWFLK
jgi:hypothetical protein